MALENDLFHFTVTVRRAAATISDFLCQHKSRSWTTARRYVLDVDVRANSVRV